MKPSWNKHGDAIAHCVRREGFRPSQEVIANAEFIVRAVNSHEALVSALREAEAAIRRMALRLDTEPGNQTVVSLWLHLADTALAALAKAEGR